MNGPRCLAGLDVGSETTCAVLVELNVAWGDGDVEARVLGIGEAPTVAAAAVAAAIRFLASLRFSLRSIFCAAASAR